MEETKTEIKSKISFSVESLLSKKEDEEDEQRSDREDDDENITVDDDDTDGRESLSPNSAHTVIIPQPLHPSIPRLGHPQWPFAWGSLMRSSSPQSK